MQNVKTVSKIYYYQSFSLTQQRTIHQMGLPWTPFLYIQSIELYLLAQH